MHTIAGIITRGEFLDKINKEISARDRSLVIYGAGNIGRKLNKLLKDNGIKVFSFCVSDVKSNPSIIDGVFVHSIEDIVKMKLNSPLFIIAVAPPTNYEIIQKLLYYEMKEYINVEKNIRHIIDDVSNRPILEITSRIGCKVNCKFCPQSVLIRRYDTKKRDAVLKLNTFKTCLDKTPKNLIVDFAGYAEPFLNEEIIKMMKYAVEKGHEIRLYTTLVGMTENVFQEMIKLPFSNVVLHLPDCKGYSKIPLTKEYYSFLSRILKAKKANGCPFVDKANGQAEPDPSVVKYIEGNVTMHQVLIDWAGNIDGENVNSTSVKYGRLICDYSVNQNHNVLLPDGTVVLCCMDWKNTCVLGNLIYDSYEEINQGRRKLAVIKEMNSECGNEEFLCRKCTNAIQV